MSKNPTTKKTPTKKKTKAPRTRRKKKNTRKAVMYQSREYTSMVETLQNVSSLSEISPYAWISYEDGGKHYQKVLAGESFALRDGLTKLSIKNEKSKFPQLDFTIECPTSLNTNTMDTRVDDLVIGKRLYVYYGYTHAHTVSGPFKISKKDVVYGEGKITVDISAKMGYKLSSVTTSNVISTQGFNLKNIKDKSVLDVIAAMGGNKINKDDLLDRERKDQLKAITSKGTGTLANRLFYHSSALDLDVFYDTFTGEIRLQTPYMLDLKRTPLKLTYGFPNSNIKNITYTHQLPNRKSSSKKKGSLGVTGNFTGGSSDTEKREYRFLVTGAFPAKLGDPFVVTQLSGYWLPDGSMTKENFEKVKKLKKYEVEKNQNIEGLPTAISAYKRYLIYEVYKGTVYIMSDLSSEPKTAQEINGLIKGGYYIIINSKPTKGKDGVFRAEVTVYSKTAPTKKKSKKPKESTTQVVETNTKGDTIVWLEKKDEYSQDFEVFYDIKTGTQRRAEYLIEGEAAKEEFKRFKKRMKQLKEQNRRISQKRSQGGKVVYQIERLEGDKEESTPDNEVAASSTNPSQSRSSTAPSHKKKKRRSVRQYEKKMDIDLSTGDFLIQVGGLIRIESLNNSVNGVFTIYSVSHTIDTNGYHTRLSCAKSMSLKSSNSKNKKQSSTRKNAQDKQAKAEVYVVETIQKEEEEVQEKPKPASTRRKFKSMKYGI